MTSLAAYLPRTTALGLGDVLEQGFDRKLAIQPKIQSVHAII